MGKQTTICRQTLQESAWLLLYSFRHTLIDKLKISHPLSVVRFYYIQNLSENSSFRQN